MDPAKRRSVVLLVAFESALFAIAVLGYGTQGDDGGDLPIGFEVVLTGVLGLGNVLGLLIGVATVAVTLHRRRRRR